MKEFGSIIAAAFVGMLLEAGPCAADGVSDGVEKVINRSATTHATYSLYIWNRIATKSRLVEEWSAEFHSGSMHRVETPRDRVVADCKAGTGSHLTLATGLISSGPEWARAACGINTNKPLLAARWQGVFQTPFGKVDRIQLTDSDNIRTYDVREDGVLIGTTYARNSPDAPILLTANASDIQSIIPDEAIFDQASLARSYVLEKFKVPPS